MKLSLLRTLSPVLLSLIFTTTIFAQQPQAIVGPQKGQQEQCGFDAIHRKMLTTDPVYSMKNQEFEAYVQSLDQSNQKVTPSQYIVPVVVHVMETGNSLTEITDAQIREGIKQLNERYRKVPGSLGDGGGVDVELEFALAVRDPLGNCTNGIVRFDMTGNATYMSDGVFRQSSGISDASLKATSVWDQTQYYNIWLVSEIDGNNGGAGIQGYAYFASAHGMSVDGTVILVSNFKDETSTTGAHELGHAFNLYHTFEGDNNGASCPPNGNCSTDGDLVCDTPPHIRAPYDCAIGTNACDGGSSEALHKYNYMDYSSDACQNEFTAGQKTRVIAAMTTQRSSFLASNGNMSLVPPDVAGVAFEASSDFVCSGGAVQFTDISSCIPNTYLDTTGWSGITFDWTFVDGASTYTSNLQNPLMTLPVGSYDVTLTITNAHGTTTHTEYDFVVVGNSPTAACTPGSNNEGNYANTVNNVQFNTISNSTSTITNVAYTDFACSANTIVTEGTTHAMNIDLRAGGSAEQIVEVYIDYNNNGSFLDAGELVLSGGTGGTSTTATVSGNVTIPTNAVEGTLLRMRVIGEAGTLNNNERSCATNLFIGDVEDYGVYIQSACVTPSISVTGTVDPSGCAASDGTITINGTGTGDATWTGPSSGTDVGVSLPHTITGLPGGVYDITYGTGGCVSSTVTATLTAPGQPALPVITAGGPTTFCDGGSVTLTSSYAAGNTWSTGATTQSITVSASGSYTVTYDAGGGCTSTSAATTVTVNALPAAPTITPGGTITICPGGSQVLTSDQASGNTWSTTETTQSITVNTAGSYTVTYTDGNGCTSAPSTAVDIVVGAAGTAVPLVEGFVDPTFPPTNWSITNGGTQSITWVRSGTQGTAPTAGNAAYIDNYSTNTTNDEDDLIVEAIDLSTYTGAQLTFDVAYARYDATYNDQLDVLVTDDCGQTYTTVYSKASSTLATDPDQTTAYTTPTTWRNETVDLSAFAGQSRVEVLFRCISGYGQLIWLDNVNLTGSGGCTPPDVPTLSASPTTTCDGGTSTITITGNLNDATAWEVYTGSCGGTSEGSTASTTIDVTPTAPGTTYYIRGEGGCTTPGTCASITINAASSTSGSESATACDSYTWSANSTTYTASGTYTATLTNAAGCDSTATLNLTINTTPVVDVLPDMIGCDVVTLPTLTVGNYYTGPGGTGSLLNAGVAISSSQTIFIYEETGTTPNCSDESSFQVTVNSSTSGSETVTACDSYTWTANTTTYTASGTYTATLTNAAGCDSTVTLNLTINNSTSGSESVTACDSYTWSANSTTYSASGTYTATLTNAAGCDSTATLNLTINNATSGSESVTACDSYTWSANSTTYTVSGVYTATITNAAGCDSIATLNLTINNATSGSESVTACDSYTWSANSTTYTVGGTYTATLTNAAGCDSTATLNLTINNSTSGSEDVTTCVSYTWPANSTTYTVGGSYTATLTNALGCDSIATLNLTITTFATGTDVVTACDSYTWIDGLTYTADNNSATHTLVGASVNGCDSLVTLNLTINNSTSGSESATACDSYTWSANSTTYTVGGTYTATLTNAAGCDSTATLNLTINNSTSGSESVTACDSYTWSANSTTYSVGGTYTATLTNAAGCDSIVTLNLTINNSTSGSESVTACGSYTWSANSATYTVGGTYTATLTNAAGCDSTATLNLTINNSSSGSESVTACDSYTWSANSTTYTVGGTYTAILTNAAGCDSTATLNLTINNSTSGSETATSCNSYTWNGTTYNSSGTYTWTGVNSVGCDSVVTLNLTINNSPVVTLDVFATYCNTDADFTLTAGSPAGGVYEGTGITAGVFSPATAGVGTHTITYQYTDGNGCSNTATDSIIVEDCSSIDELTNTVISVYPNPTIGNVTIESDGDNIQTIDIYDAAGRLVERMQVNDVSIMIDLTKYSVGVYQLQIEAGDKVYWNRLVKN